MVKTPEDIFKIIEKECSFNQESGVFTSCERDWCVLDPLRNCADLAGVDWTYDEGVSKFVLIFRDLGFVIKIPYTGSNDGDGDVKSPCDDCTRWSSCRGSCQSCSRYQNWEYDEYKYYQSFGGADFTPRAAVRKELERSWDYCEAEAWFYNKAKENGVEVCFAETRLLGFVDGHPIYTQPLATIYSDYYTSSRKTHTLEEKISTKEACKRIDGWCFNVDWLTDFILFFGDDMFQNFMNFIKEYGVDDLHNGNVGYVDGVPVLVDYSGYND